MDLYQVGSSYVPASRLAALQAGDTLTGALDPATLGVSLPVGLRWFAFEQSSGLFKPTYLTVGARGPLTTYNGNIIVTTPGTVLQNLDVHGYIKVQTSGVFINNVRVRGYQIPPSSSAGESTIGLITCHDVNASSLKIRQVTLVPDFPSWDWDGVLGHDFDIDDFLIAHTTDGFGIYNTHNPGGPVNVSIAPQIGGVVDWLAWFSPTQSSNVDNATHGDCIQILGGTNIRVGRAVLNGFRSMPDGLGVNGSSDPLGYVGQGGSTTPPAGYSVASSGPYNPTYPAPQSGSAVQFNNQQGTPQIVFDGAWADGGGASLNISVPLAAGSVIANMKFGRNQRLQGAGGDDTFTINGGGSSGANLTVTNDTYEDNGHPVRWRK